MLKDKSRVLVFGALVLLVLVLMNGGNHMHGIHLFQGFSWLSWALFGLFVWLLFTRSGCCSGNSEDILEDEDLEEVAEDEE